MKEKQTIIAAIDIGSSKVCCLVSGLPRQKEALDILGYGLCHHNCLSNGVVTDIKALAEAISAAVYEAEEISRKKVQSVFFNISGMHLKSMMSHGEIVISDRDNEITRHDVDRVIANAKAIHMPYEQDIIYSAREDFIVDNESGIKNPAGMFGIKLEVNIFLVTAKIAIIDNLKKAIRYSGMGIEDSIISSLAGTAASVTGHEKSLGVVYADIGAEMTDIMIFVKSHPVFLKTLPLGGNSITKALAEGLFIAEQTAETLKIDRGTVEDIRRDEKISVSTEAGKKSISRINLKNILLKEYTRIFDSIKREIHNSGYAEKIPGGIVLCGQPVVMDGCIELAESVLDNNVRMGHIIGLGAVPKPLPSHIYATAVGLLKIGIESRKSKISLFKLGPKNWVLALAKYAERLYNDYF
jgi:cell division protein FtsA